MKRPATMTDAEIAAEVAQLRVLWASYTPADHDASWWVIDRVRDIEREEACRRAA